MSLEESCCPGKLCKSFRLYVVAGLRTSSGSSGSITTTKKDEYAFGKIRSWFKIGEDRFGVLSSVDDIRRELKKTITCTCEKINKVFVAHSYGAQNFYEALTKWEMLPMRTAKVCQRAALIGIAGVTLFPKDTVQITANFAFKNDMVCGAGKTFLEKFGKEKCDLFFLGPFHRTGENMEKDFKCDCCAVRMDSEQPTDDCETSECENESEMESLHNSEDQNCPAPAEPAPPVKLSLKKKHVFKAHYLYDYVCCKRLETEIKQLLVSNDN